MTESAEHEKQAAALNSVMAAVLLAGLKVVVGLWSGSLGILAEAAHSGLDFIAAVVTLLAVRAAGRPADAEHPYGHGKIENLSALAEALLLLGTCAWIIRESLERLANKQAHIEASVWAFAIMAISILVDITRSRMLYRAAAKHHSQALEADALHFRTDIWSSAVVIVGLIGVRAAGAFPALGFLVKADAVAALGVAIIVVWVSVRLGFRTVQGLLDTAPAGVEDQVRAAAEAVPGVLDCHAIRIRHSGPRCFLDLHVVLEGSQTLESAHQITEHIEQAVQAILPEADVTVHPEPIAAHPDRLKDKGGPGPI